MNYLSQKGQDRWVIEEALPERRSGYFVDLAATDGVTINNTLLLERELGWSGIAIEPNRDFFVQLSRDRNCLSICACVDGHAHAVTFLPNGELGGIIDGDTDNTPALRASLISEWQASGKLQVLQTVTLAEILDMHQAPPVIDYLSLDVEGAETRIMRTFPFDRYRFLAMTIERPTAELNQLLFANDYMFVRNASMDGFYLHRSAPTAGVIAREPFEQIPVKDW